MHDHAVMHGAYAGLSVPVTVVSGTHKGPLTRGYVVKGLFASNSLKRAFSWYAERSPLWTSSPSWVYTYAMTDLSKFLAYSIYTVPPQVAGTTRRVRIGWQKPYSSQQPGRYAMQDLGGMNSCGLRRDGTWGKYGEAFATEQEAFDVLMASPYADVYDRWEEQREIQTKPSTRV